MQTSRVQSIPLSLQSSQVLCLLVDQDLCGFNLRLVVGFNASWGDWQCSSSGHYGGCCRRRNSQSWIPKGVRVHLVTLLWDIRYPGPDNTRHQRPTSWPSSWLGASFLQPRIHLGSPR